MSLQTDAETLLERIPDYSRLTRAEVASLLHLHQAGKTQTEIAQILGCDQSNVSRWLDKLLDTSDVAKHRLRNGSLELAERILKQADVDQSLEVLDRLDVAPKKRDQQSSGINVILASAIPGIQVNVIANYQTQKQSEPLNYQALAGTLEAESEAKVEGESV